jgi:IclR family KDG regulon transcriptional repressor
MGDNANNVRSVERALAILQAFSFLRPELGLIEISNLVGLNKATTHRIISTLVDNGFVTQDPKTGKYKLGLKSFEIGQIAMSMMELRSVARPIVERLRDISEETVHVVVLDRGKVLYIDKVDSPRSIRMTSFIGQRVFPHSTAVGKVLLASLSDDEVVQICQRNGMPAQTPYTITSIEKLLDKLKKIRDNDFAVDDEENELGLRCLAAPVRDFAGKVIAAISISGPTTRVAMERVPELIEHLKNAALEISRQMGYKG